MTPAEATAEVFFTAFLNISHTEQDAFISKLLKNKKLREDLIDLAIAEKRKKEYARPFHKVAEEIKSERSK